MDKTVFETRAISVFHDLKYVFYDELQQGETLKQISTNQKALLVTGAFLAGGLLGALGTGSSKFTDEEVAAELVKLGTLCDLIGIRLSGGMARLT
jgi:hypothetical protein